MKLAITTVAVAAKGRGKNGFSPVEVRLFDVDQQTTPYARCGRGRFFTPIKTWWASNAKYNGPKSLYGQGYN